MLNCFKKQTIFPQKTLQPSSPAFGSSCTMCPSSFLPLVLDPGSAPGSPGLAQAHLAPMCCKLQAAPQPCGFSQAAACFLIQSLASHLQGRRVELGAPGCSQALVTSPAKALCHHKLRWKGDVWCPNTYSVQTSIFSPIFILRNRWAMFLLEQFFHKTKCEADTHTG